MVVKLKMLIIPFPSTVGTRFDAATVDEELVRAYREKQKAKTDKILDEYLTICLKKGVCMHTYTTHMRYKVSTISKEIAFLQVHAEKLCVEMDSIEKGIVQMISENKVRKFIMGAAKDKHYSTYCVLGFTCSFLYILNLTLVVINLQENGGTEVEESHLCMPTRTCNLSYSVYLQRTSHPHKVQARVLLFHSYIYI